MSNVQAFYHLVINTKHRRMTLPADKAHLLYAYMVGIAKRTDSYVLAINGIENHLHLLLNLSPRMALSDFVRELKRASSLWLKQQGPFPDFEGWGKEFFAASVSLSNCEAVKRYIDNQRIHHCRVHFDDELRRFVEGIGNIWNENILT